MLAPTQPRSAPFAAEVAGNRIVLIPDGPDRLDALLRLIADAEQSLRLNFYIFKDDHSGRRVRDGLLEAQARGVEISLLIDGFGSEDVSDDFFRPLIESDCHFCRFEPRWGRRYLLRNHQKFAIADGKRAIAGGFNIADDYFGTVEQHAWRDLAFTVEGPAAAWLAEFFDDLQAWSGQRQRQFRNLRRLLQRHSRRTGPVRWLFGGPTRRFSPWAKTVKNDMMRARHFDLIAAYFAPNSAMLRRIAAIGRRGRARLITAAKSDNGATIGAARHTYSRLLRGGVEIYEYQLTKLHTKLIVAEDVVHIGSSNFDMRSLYLNLEVMLRVEDPAFAEMIRGYVDGEIESSAAVSRSAHKSQASWFNRLVWAICYFVVATTDYTVTRRLNFGVRAR